MKTIGASAGFIIMIAISLFLKGKIAAIPFGTHEGGVIASMGVLVILVISFIILFVLTKLFKKNKQ